MYELITDKTLAEYEAFVQSHPKGNFAQSSLWAKQKPMWTWDAVAVRGEDGKIKGSLALMTRKVPGIGRTLMYGCRGPVCDLDDRETFAQLLEGAKALAKKYNTTCRHILDANGLEDGAHIRPGELVLIPISQ